MLLNHSAAAGAIYQTACRATCALLPLPTLKTCLDPETVAVKMAASIAEHVPAEFGSKMQLTEDDWRQFTDYVSLQSTAAAYIRPQQLLTSDTYHEHLPVFTKKESVGTAYCTSVLVTPRSHRYNLSFTTCQMCCTAYLIRCTTCMAKRLKLMTSLLI